ncbi:DUF4331 family protein [Saccharothrix sp. ST-888]|uniref:DUF4331 family protein n=1 Tax=Saccharothrix sp. ST-888 TaxID=1427391 RepID=UPI0005ECE88E|nr:DUF4331 family protein [Saccharothrix sp. ST-888]KJK59282.1 hypothetical protein UK12_05545 [Saccharothrix sp. ST-888]
MSHHLSGPDGRSPRGDARLDLTDVYAFAAHGGRTVLVMNVHPDAPAKGAAFHPDVVHRIDIDTDGDHRADVAYSFVFSDPQEGPQTCTVHRATGEQARAHQAGGKQVLTGVPIGLDLEPAVVVDHTFKFFAGLRSDPFFVDLDGIVQGFRWTGADWGADKNVLSIVLELTDEDLGTDGPIGVWARVSLYEDGRLTSVDRGAHPSLIAYFAENEGREDYNAGEPADDLAAYLVPFTAVLQRTGGYDRASAERTVRTVLPDVLRYDRTRPAAYPNGRTLTDDVSSARLAMVTGGRITSDHIPAHTDLLPDFPYLGHPHPARTG